ncbi:hypothetical protein FB567DRAFT_618395 [Paraphoma chrysanthemicola]|uniref:Uncharacterized protein n=1 Tax=Paraphoma chrysanthemicola TaxID=798071 RepID=A0A8K0RBG0_9PLEO|nr:hypothetical protein FB567DRAFT_618395 [Paraphoma chrysanthemicola]
MFKTGMGSTPTFTCAPPKPFQKLRACIIRPHAESHNNSVTWSHRIEDLNISEDGIRSYIKKLGPDYSIISTIAELPQSKLQIIQQHAKTQNGQLVAVEDGIKEVDMATPMGTFKVKIVVFILETSEIEEKSKVHGVPSQDPTLALHGSSDAPPFTFKNAAKNATNVFASPSPPIGKATPNPAEKLPSWAQGIKEAGFRDEREGHGPFDSEVSRYMSFPFPLNKQPEQKQSFEEQRLTDYAADRKAPFVVEKPNPFLVPGTSAAPKKTLFFGTSTFNQDMFPGYDDHKDSNTISSNGTKGPWLAGSAPLEGTSPPATVPVSHDPPENMPTASSSPQAWAKFCRQSEVSHPILRALALVSPQSSVDDTKSTIGAQPVSLPPSTLDDGQIEKVQNNCSNTTTTSVSACQLGRDPNSAESSALAKQAKDTISDQATLTTSTPPIFLFNASSGVKATNPVLSGSNRSPKIPLFGHGDGVLRNVGNTPVPPRPSPPISAQPAVAASTTPFFRFGQFKVPEEQPHPTTPLLPLAKQGTATDATCWLCDNKVQEDGSVAPPVQENASSVIKDDEQAATDKVDEEGLEESVQVIKKLEPTTTAETSETVAAQSTNTPRLIEKPEQPAAGHCCTS